MMVGTFGGTWLREEDLAAAIPGREDSPRLIAECIEYLRLRHRRIRAEQGIDERTRNAIFHAHVQRAAASPRMRELEQQVAQQEATINRLLAFVPAHVGAIPADRLGEIAGIVARTAAKLFAGDQIQIQSRDEDDPETEACHRIEVTVRLSKEIPVTELVSKEVELHRAFVASVSRDEVRAIGLLVNFE